MKKAEAQEQAITGPKAVIDDCERCMREKNVVRYDPAIGSFRPASMAQYTENQTAQTLQSQVPQVRGAEKLVFNL